MIPEQMNCSHNPDGWCLACVRKLQDRVEYYKGFVEDMAAADETSPRGEQLATLAKIHIKNQP